MANTQTLLGQTVIGKSLYNVYGFGPLSTDAQAAGIVAKFGLEGPRGAWYFVTDYGQGYRLNVVAVGGGRAYRCQPRHADHIRREHLALFYEAVR